MLTRITSNLRSLASRSIWTKPHSINFIGGLVSFTFDDVPESALREGSRVLEDHGVRGTFYACFGLAGTHGESGRLFEPEDLRSTHLRGHELACHTYTHLDCTRASDDEILRDLAKNAAGFSALIEGYVPRNFAYPFGNVSLRIKRLLAPKFWSCRGIRSGINRGSVDLDELRANSIYSTCFDDDAMRRLIDLNCAAGGWLIFWTHDVAASPSPNGCSSSQLASVVAYASERSTVLPVSAAIKALSAHRDW